MPSTDYNGAAPELSAMEKLRSCSGAVLLLPRNSVDAKEQLWSFYVASTELLTSFNAAAPLYEDAPEKIWSSCVKSL